MKVGIGSMRTQILLLVIGVGNDDSLGLCTSAEMETQRNSV